MKTNFSQPQRQSIVGVFVMFFYTLQQYARALYTIFIISILQSKRITLLYVILGIIVFLIVVGVISYLKYLKFTFFLDEKNKEFVISEGVFTTTKTSIQLHKIQQVNINQSFIQKLIGVYELSVDTAGSNKKEGAIKAISHQMALDLKSLLLDNDVNAPSNNVAYETIQSHNENEIQSETPFIKISFLTLLKVGITSNYGKTIGLILAFFISIYENVSRALGEENADSKIMGFIEDKLAGSITLFFIIGLFLLVILFNLIRTIVKFFNYKITKQKRSILLSYGLLNTKNTIIKPEKVQITSVTRNFFQKKMDILEIKIKQATGDVVEENKSAIEIPGCNAVERDAILKLLFAKVPEKGIQLNPNFRTLVFGLFLLIFVPFVLFLSFGKWIDSQVFDYIYAVPVYMTIVSVILYFRFINNRLFINDSFIIKQSGAWDITNEIIEPSKIQAITTSQLFWHKKPDIGSIKLHTAGGTIVFKLGNFTKIKHYVNLWLYEIETSNSNWM